MQHLPGVATRKVTKHLFLGLCVVALHCVSFLFRVGVCEHGCNLTNKVIVVRTLWDDGFLCRGLSSLENATHYKQLVVMKKLSHVVCVVPVFCIHALNTLL